MASILKVKDNDGNIIDIPILEGPPGKTGPAGKITEVTASVDSTVGTPSVAITLGGTEEERTIDLAFSGLKGEVGDPTKLGDTAGNFAVTGENGVVEAVTPDEAKTMLGLDNIKAEVTASDVTAGTFAGEVKANPDAVVNLNTAQVRNVMIGTEEPTDEIIASLNVGDFYFVREV